MELRGRHVVVTGGGSGIGRALVERFASDAAGVVVVDRDGAAAAEVAASVGGLAITADVGREREIRRVITEAEEAYGPVDLFCSNAGQAHPLGGLDTDDEGWTRQWNVHVMAHLWAARALVPAMVRRGGGYLLSTISAVGLLMVPGALPYTVTKHAALALAEQLAVLYRGSGVRFSCLCPALVETPLIEGVGDGAVGRFLRLNGPPMDPAEVADIVVEGLREERFLIFTHPETAPAVRLRAADPERYLDAVAAIWAAAGETEGPPV
ncbi:SDR family oxidoreductase [Planotetraspora kaengkrachanensis]|uniref:Dehydrogenase n=1 Tax=Planotetraspora kaengkrachanensis TaxID=575193 RepID=A0A8J3LZB7_9ACTN|nr:SDR family oxidoreductase [Planotetraspora kaengkrachanensis]GIG80714.1 dehydrogenase [Planotetraspora kaengkrachanensis]